jgi:hypothetical protein
LAYSTQPLTFSEHSLSKESDYEVVCRLERMFASALFSPVWRSWRDNADQDFKFYEGDQWTALEKGILEERGQPVVTENLIKPKIERLLGQFQRQHSTVTVLGRNAPVDEMTAASAADVFRWVDQVNGAEFEESDQIKDGYTGGFGVLEVRSAKDDSGQPTIIIRNENPFYIFPDPHSRRYDWNEDAKFICRSKWLDLEDAIALWPDKAKELRMCVNTLPSGLGGTAMPIDPSVLRLQDWTYIDPNRGRLRPVEISYKRKVVKHVIITPEGVRVELDYLGPRQAKQAAAQLPGSTVDRIVAEEMWLGIYCAGTLIHHDRDIDQDGMFPFIPYFADRKKSGEPFGPVRNLVSLQKEINKRRSKALALLSNNQAIVGQNAVEDWAEFDREKANPSGTMKVRKVEEIQLLKNQDMGQSQMVMHGESKQTFNEASGLGPEAMGMNSEVRSGVGIARKQMATDLITMPLFTNIRRTRRIKIKKVWGLICQHFTDDLVFQITDDPAAAKVVQLPKQKLDAMRDMAFNFVIADVEDSLTLQQEQITEVMNILPQILPFGIPMAQFVLELSNVRPKQKEGLMKILQGMAQTPPPEPKISIAMNWSELTPEEKAVLAFTKLNMPQLAEFELTQGEPSAKRLSLEKDMAKQASVERMNDKRQEVELILHGADSQREMVIEKMHRETELQKKDKDIEKEKAKPKPRAAGKK